MIAHAPLLRADAVSRSYPGMTLPAVDTVSLAVRAGGITGIVGESGSGKTTLARLMAGLLRPSQGQLWFDGQPIGGLGTAALRRLRRDLQYVHQDPAASLDPRMRVAAILEEPLLVHMRLSTAERQARGAAALAAVGLPTSLQHRYPHQLSGGQQRRVGLARILILRPRLVVLDEPTAGLDLLVQASLLALLRDLQASFGLTYVVVTHDLSVVGALCDQVAVMYRGRVVEAGEAATVLAAPCHPYTQALLAAQPDLDGPRLIDTLELPDPAAPDEVFSSGCHFRPRCDAALPRCATTRPELQHVAGRDVACWAMTAQEFLHHQGEPA